MQSGITHTNGSPEFPELFNNKRGEFMKTVTIFGCGAIGRGFFPWIFSENTSFIYVDSNYALIENLKKKKNFKTYMIKNNNYIERNINNCHFLHFSELDVFRIIDKSDVIIVCVGVRNTLNVINKIKTTTKPIIIAENDYDLYVRIKTQFSKNNILFCIPDVITSNTAPEYLLEEDDLALVTENGKCYIENGCCVSGTTWLLSSKQEIRNQWDAKLFLHNTPHCIAAYFGSIYGKRYIHEAMEIEEVNNVVLGAMNEMKMAMEKTGKYNLDFLNFYSDKEIKRFRNKLLYDPILRTLS